MERYFFGQKEVDKNEKDPLVSRVFSSVAPNYDLMNDLMSLRLHRYWKKMFISEIPNFRGKLLDVAGGSGDIAGLYIKQALEYSNSVPDVTLLDINQDMLAQGEKNLEPLKTRATISFQCASAEDLPFPDNSFDYYTISYGIRNVTDIPKALSEAFRVLKPGGKFLCLEFSHVNNSVLSKFYDLYLTHAIPFLGDKVAKDRDAYIYLAESIKGFPTQEKFMHMIEESGFIQVKYKNLSFGVTAIHSGYKI